MKFPTKLNDVSWMCYPIQILIHQHCMEFPPAYVCTCRHAFILHVHLYSMSTLRRTSWLHDRKAMRPAPTWSKLQVDSGCSRIKHASPWRAASPHDLKVSPAWSVKASPSCRNSTSPVVRATTSPPRRACARIAHGVRSDRSCKLAGTLQFQRKLLPLRRRRRRRRRNADAWQRGSCGDVSGHSMPCRRRNAASLTPTSLLQRRSCRARLPPRLCQWAASNTGSLDPASETLSSS